MTDYERSLPDDPRSESPDDLTWVSLARFSGGTADPGEAELVREHLLENPGDADFLMLLERSLPHRAGWEVTPAEIDAALQKVKRKDGRGSRPALRVLRGAAMHGGRSRSWNLGVAAGLAAALLLGAMALWPRTRSTTVDGAHEIAMRTSAGQRDSVRLADGTRIVLAPLSSLTVPADYGADRRDVRLSGEALFEVRHDPKRPFAVVTANATIEDLGTTFTVSDDASDSTVVRVTQGSVRLRSRGASSADATLGAGDVGIVHSSGVEVRHGNVAVRDTAWVHGELSFRDAPMDEVTTQIRRWYGVQLRVADEVLERRHVTAILADEPVDRALQVIALALGAEVERTGDTAVVRLPRQPSSSR